MQCKYRKRDQVGVNVVRGLLGVMHHEAADGAILACTHGFTSDARKFAAANSIELVDGEEIRSLLRQSGVEGRRLLGKVERFRHGAGMKYGVVKMAAMVLLPVAFIGFVVPMAKHVSSSVGQGDLAPRTGSVEISRSSRDVGQAQIAELSTGKVTTRDGRESGDPVWEARFNEWYEPPPECIATQSNPQPDLVACGNHRIRARRDFGE